jgi:hypothetical protein
MLGAMVGAVLFEAPVLDITAAIAVLSDLGVLPVITFAALVGIGSMLYRRFRK